MKKIITLMMITAVLAVSLPASAATVAYWDFENSTLTGGAPTDGQSFDDGSNGNGYYGTTDNVSGYLMRGWGSTYGPSFSSTTPTGSGFSMRNVDQDGYVYSDGTADPLVAWAPLQWTIEATFKLDADRVDAQWWETLISRDGAGDNNPGNASSLYFQKTWDNYFRVDFATVGGERFEASSISNGYQVEADRWYSMAATSDGTTLSLWINGISGISGWVLVAQTDMSGAIDSTMDSNPANWVFGRGWYNGQADKITGYMDNIRFSDVALTPYEFLSVASPYSPNPTPLNEDGSVGTLSGSDALVTLNFNAGADPNTVTDDPVNPDVVTHYVRIGTIPGTLPVDGFVTQVHNADPNLTDPANSYGPVTLTGGTLYYWQVEEGLDNGTGNAYSAGDPNNILGPVWSFTTVAATPTVTDPVNAVADVNGIAALSVTPSASADSFQWYKVGTPDTALTDSGAYSGTTTPTLTITGVTSSEEGQYYIIAYNGLTPSEPSAAAWVWERRLMNHYPFEVINIVDGNSFTPDIVGDYDAMLMQEGTAGLPVLSDANQLEVDLAGSSYALLLDNSDHATDPNGQYAQIPAGILAYQDVTISVWVHPKSVAVWARIFDFGTAQNNTMWLTPDIGSGYDPRFAIEVNGSGQQQLNPDLNSGNWISPGSWHQVVVTIDGDTGRMYVDGELRATNIGMTHDPIDLGATLNYIGKSEFNDPEFDGLIDELKIYNYALTTEEIGQEYVNAAGGWVCNNEVADLLHDFNNDCRVDLADFALVASEWLDCLRIPTHACTW